MARCNLPARRVGTAARSLTPPSLFCERRWKSGVNHIDTSDFYGPHVTNQLIKQALHPYPDGLVIVTKVGARRGADKSWLHALSRQELIDGVHDNLRNLGLDTLDVVNLRVGGSMRTFGRIDRGTADRARGAQASGTDPPYRPEQRYPKAVG